MSGANDRSERIDGRILFGLALTTLWVGLALAYIAFVIGWYGFVGLPPSELGSFLEGVVAPLAFLWLVLGMFLQQSELAENSRALALQSEALQKSAEQAEIQARAEAALKIKLAGAVELRLPDSPAQAARVLYAELRRLSHTNRHVIYITRDARQTGTDWEAIWDRIGRAATVEF